MATPIQWLPEDDLELKNAIERGASLEALAKGAGQFSQRFSLRELRDRWYSLLYDPGVSAQASSHMFELEIAKLNRSDINPRVNKISQKRKSETLRRKYYAMRKKYRSDILSNADLGFFEPNPQFTEHVASDFQKQEVLDANSLGQSSMLGDNISDILGPPEDYLDILSESFPDPVTDMGGTSGTANFPQAEFQNSFEENHTNGRIGNYGFGEDISSLKQDWQIFEPPNPEDFATFETDMFASDQPPLHHYRAMQDVSVTAVPIGTNTGDTAEMAHGVFDIEGKENSSLVYTGEFAGPDSLLNLSVGDELLINLDDTEDKSFINKVKSGSIKDAETSSLPLASAHLPVLEVVPLLIHGDQQINVHTESNVSVNQVSDPVISEPRAKKICCTLNTQNTEIPCNDDIFLLIHPSATLCGSAAQPITITSNDASAGVLEKNNEQSVTKDSTKGFGCSQNIRTQGLSDSNTNHPFLGRAVKTEVHAFRPQLPVPGLANKTIIDSSEGKFLSPIPNGSHDRLVEKDDTGYPIRVGGRPTTVTDIIQSTEAGSGRIVPQKFFEEEKSEIDDDIPPFSDVEAMLHGMDLDPVEHDSQVIQQVPSYQNDETKRTRIRLEQAACSCSHREMTSKGALAIFFGIHLRHYINKPEVLLGRSTGDIDVDIDLRKEGLANNISRRQAIIKLEEDGSFSIQNLGKTVYVVPVDGSLRVDTDKVKAVATGQFLTLSSSCLIEIRGMCFSFEINERYVKQHLGKLLTK